jgi:hypothetical protein
MLRLRVPSVAALAVLPALLLAVVPAAARRPPSAPAIAPVRGPLDQAYAADAQRLIGAALTSDRAWLRLQQLCDGFGPRPNGSATLDHAIDWLATAMRGDGLEGVRLQPVMVPHWERGEERAAIVEPGPRPLAILGLGRSAGTPPGGLTADVVAVSSFGALDSLPDAAVRGRIVLYDVPFTGYGPTVRYRFSGANRAAARGAVAMLLRSITGTALANLHTGVMGAYVDSLPRIPAAAVSVEDAQMIHRLASRGERVRVHLEMGGRTLPDTLSANVVAEVRGRERPDEVVVVGGHTDSWDVGSGAVDDGAGCVMAWEAVRLIHALGLRPRRTVRCALWVNEECGTRGGIAYADSLGARVSSHVAAIEADIGAERPVGFDVGVPRPDGSGPDSARTERAVARLRELAPLLAGIGADRMRAGGGGTDIDPLFRRGVTCLGHRTAAERYFDWHHSPADMVDKVDPIELRRNVAALAVLVYVLADMPETLAGPPAP